MFVHEVIAAITTDPSPTSSSRASIFMRVFVISAVLPPPPFIVGNTSRNVPCTLPSVTRSCGRFGPATAGSTVPRSKSILSTYFGSGSPGAWKRPWVLQYRSTRSTTASRPVPRRYASVWSSTGKKPSVAPYSGDMFATVARSGTVSACKPGPTNSTNRPTTPCARSSCVRDSTMSVAVAPSGKPPESRTPTTSGTSMFTASPSIAASASMPPTPQPSTPIPPIIVVCESVPTKVSGNAVPSAVATTVARFSRFTW